MFSNKIDWFSQFLPYRVFSRTEAFLCLPTAVVCDGWTSSAGDGSKGNILDFPLNVFVVVSFDFQVKTYRRFRYCGPKPLRRLVKLTFTDSCLIHPYFCCYLSRVVRCASTWPWPGNLVTCSWLITQDKLNIDQLNHIFVCFGNVICC